MAEMADLLADALDDDGQHDGLTIASARALKADDASLAFRFADRRCRLSRRAGARDRLLRAEALRRMGEPDAAWADIAAAAELDPTEPLVNVRLLESPDQDVRKRAAWSLLNAPMTAAGERLAAARSLFGMGEPVLFRIRRSRDRLVGWASWPGAGQIDLLCTVDGIEHSHRLARQPTHPLSGQNNACLIDVPVGTDGDCRITFCRDGAIVAKTVCAADRALQPATRVDRTEPSVRSLLSVVPVYEDFEATRDCLETLLAQELGAVRHRIIVIDDASPNDAIRALVRDLDEQGKIELLVNDGNRGFAFSVNRAIDQRDADEDVVLVNADTLLPKTALLRLATAAHASPSIGTVTPWSNNGELLSLPQRSVVNPIRGLDEVEVWDKAVELANGTAVVDIPNGIGFCLLITAPCLDELGGLSDSYGRGYFEDVDLCLRARSAGFRNVCAVGVFVGHLGSRSFNQAKRELVARNLKILSARFPDYPVESTAYVELDPLRTAREAAARSVLPVSVDLLIVSRFPAAEGVEVYAGGARAQGLRVVVAVLGLTGAIALTGEEGEPPHALSFDIADIEERHAFASYLDDLAPDRIAVFDPTALPEPLWELVVAAGRPLDWLVADGLLLAPTFRPWAGACRSPGQDLCDACADEYQHAVDAGPTGTAAARLADAQRIAQRIRPLGDRPAALIARVLGPTASEKILAAPATVTMGPGIRPVVAGDVLAVVTSGRTMEAMDLIRALSLALRGLGGSREIVVFGHTLGDVALMARGNVFVAGHHAPEGLADGLRRARARAIVLPHRHFAGETPPGLPKAYFDFSFGEAVAEPGDLALDPRLCHAGAAGRIVHWFGRQ